MADTVTLNPGSGGDVIWADDLGASGKTQGIKLITGGDGVGQYGATAASPLVSTGSGADKTAIKASPGTLYGVIAVNTDTAANYLQLYNLTSANTTVGSSTRTMTIPLPASGGVAFNLALGVKFDTAITAAITTTIAGSTSVAADKVVVTLLYA